MLKLKLQYSGHLMQRADSSQKRPCCWESLKAGEGAARDEMVGWHHRLDWHELEETPGNSEEQGCLACCCPGVQGVANSGTQLSDWITFTILFHYLLTFFGQFYNSIVPKLFIFLSKKLFQVLLTIFQGIENFPLREFWKDWNKWKSEDAVSGKYGRWIRPSRPSCNRFCLVIREICSLALSWWKTMCFLLTNTSFFSLSAAFSWSNGEQCLLELIVLFSRRSS